MIVGGVERTRNVALQPLRKRDEARELRQRQRLFQSRPRALLEPQQRGVGADQRARAVDAAANDALAHASSPGVAGSGPSSQPPARERPESRTSDIDRKSTRLNPST